MDAHQSEEVLHLAAQCWPHGRIPDEKLARLQQKLERIGTATRPHHLSESTETSGTASGTAQHAHPQSGSSSTARPVEAENESVLELASGSTIEYADEQYVVECRLGGNSFERIYEVSRASASTTRDRFTMRVALSPNSNCERAFMAQAAAFAETHWLARERLEWQGRVLLPLVLSTGKARLPGRVQPHAALLMEPACCSLENRKLPGEDVLRLAWATVSTLAVLHEAGFWYTGAIQPSSFLWISAQQKGAAQPAAAASSQATALPDGWPVLVGEVKLAQLEDRGKFEAYAKSILKSLAYTLNRLRTEGLPQLLRDLLSKWADFRSGTSMTSSTFYTIAQKLEKDSGSYLSWGYQLWQMQCVNHFPSQADALANSGAVAVTALRAVAEREETASAEQEDDAEAAATLICLARNLQREGEDLQALEALRRAIDIRPSMLVEAKWILIDIGTILSASPGFAEQARHVLERAEKVYEKSGVISMGFEASSDMQRVYAQLRISGAYRKLSHSAQADDLAKSALSLLRTCDDSDMRKAGAMSSASSHVQDPSKKCEHLKKALQIQEAHFGNSHCIVAETWQQLGKLYSEAGEGSHAVEAFEAALQIVEGQLGRSHVVVATALAACGTACLTVGDAAKAKEMLERALKIQEEHYSPSHVRVARSLLFLADACGALGDVAAKKELLERALGIFEPSLGPEHAYTALTLRRLKEVGVQDQVHSKHSIDFDVQSMVLDFDEDCATIATLVSAGASTSASEQKTSLGPGLVISFSSTVALALPGGCTALVTARTMHQLQQLGKRPSFTQDDAAWDEELGELASPVLLCEPEGVTFADPIMLAFPLPATSRYGLRLMVKEPGGSWMQLHDAKFSADKVFIRKAHFCHLCIARDKGRKRRSKDYWMELWARPVEGDGTSSHMQLEQSTNSQLQVPIDAHEVVCLFYMDDDPCKHATKPLQLDLIKQGFRCAAKERVPEVVNGSKAEVRLDALFQPIAGPADSESGAQTQVWVEGNVHRDSVSWTVSFHHEPYRLDFPKKVWLAAGHARRVTIAFRDPDATSDSGTAPSEDEAEMLMHHARDCRRDPELKDGLVIEGDADYEWAGLRTLQLELLDTIFGQGHVVSQRTNATCTFKELLAAKRPEWFILHGHTEFESVSGSYSYSFKKSAVIDPVLGKSAWKYEEVCEELVEYVQQMAGNDPLRFAILATCWGGHLAQQLSERCGLDSIAWKVSVHLFLVTAYVQDFFASWREKKETIAAAEAGENLKVAYRRLVKKAHENACSNLKQVDKWEAHMLDLGTKMRGWAVSYNSSGECQLRFQEPCVYRRYAGIICGPCQLENGYDDTVGLSDLFFELPQPDLINLVLVDSQELCLPSQLLMHSHDFVVVVASTGSEGDQGSFGIRPNAGRTTSGFLHSSLISSQQQLPEFDGMDLVHVRTDGAHSLLPGDTVWLEECFHNFLPLPSEQCQCWEGLVQEVDATSFKLVLTGDQSEALSKKMRREQGQDPLYCRISARSKCPLDAVIAEAEVRSRSERQSRLKFVVFLCPQAMEERDKKRLKDLGVACLSWQTDAEAGFPWQEAADVTRRFISKYLEELFDSTKITEVMDEDLGMSAIMWLSSSLEEANYPKHLAKPVLF